MSPHQTKIKTTDPYKTNKTNSKETSFSIKNLNEQKQFTNTDDAMLSDWANVQARMKLPGPTNKIQFSASTQPIPNPKSIHHIAASGLTGSSRSLPYLNQIQKSFGSYDVSNVRAFTGTRAAAANRALSSKAYATDNGIAFAGSPSMHTVAHEVAHNIQQRTGVQLKDGVGGVNDKYERQADQVADSVVQGKSVEHLFDKPFNQATNIKQPTVQRKLKVNNLKIDGTNIDAKAQTLAGQISNIHEKNIKQYLNEFIELAGDEEVYKFANDNDLKTYLLERHKLGNAFAKPDKLLRNYTLFKLFVNKQTSLFSFKRRGFPARGIFNPGYLYPNYTGDITSFYTRNVSQPSAASLNNIPSIPRINYHYHAKGFGVPPLQTNIYWGDVIRNGSGDKVMGTKMLAYPLGPDHPLGQTTKDKETEAKTAQDKYGNMIGRSTVALHLLNNHIGGPATVYNLVPMTSSVNSHHSGIETGIKNAVNRDHHWIWYYVEAIQKPLQQPSPPTLVVTGKKGKPTQNDQKKNDKETKIYNEKLRIYNASSHFNHKYNAELKIKWGQLSDGSASDGSGGQIALGEPIPGTKLTYKLTAPYPLDDNYVQSLIKNNSHSQYFETKKEDGSNNPSAIDSPNKATSILKYYNLILDDPKQVEDQLIILLDLINRSLDRKLERDSLKLALASLQDAIKNNLTAAIKRELVAPDLYREAKKLNKDKVVTSDIAELEKYVAAVEKIQSELKIFDVDNFINEFDTAKTALLLSEFNIENNLAKEIVGEFIRKYVLLSLREKTNKLLTGLNEKNIGQLKEVIERHKQSLSFNDAALNLLLEFVPRAVQSSTLQDPAIVKDFAQPTDLEGLLSGIHNNPNLIQQAEQFQAVGEALRDAKRKRKKEKEEKKRAKKEKRKEKKQRVEQIADISKDLIIIYHEYLEAGDPTNLNKYLTEADISLVKEWLKNPRILESKIVNGIKDFIVKDNDLKQKYNFS